MDSSSAVFNPLNHPIILTKPDRITEITAWIEHVPFGMLLIDLLRPQILVELGTETGVSYCGFCQAIEQLGLTTRCYAVDTWEGDSHSGSYGQDVIQQLRAYHDPKYGSFSNLMQMTFDDAIQYFSDGSIDLLHIDGLHTYDAVKHDFENWLPKVSRHGVVLLHDINVRERDFGVWQFWEEVSKQFPSLEFLHGHGLGLLAVGVEPLPAIIELISMKEDDLQTLRELFYGLSSKYSFAINKQVEVNHLINEVQKLLGMNQGLTAEIQGLKTLLSEMDQKIQALTTQLSDRDMALQNYQKNFDEAALTYQRNLAEKEEIIRSISMKLERWEVEAQALEKKCVESDREICQLSENLSQSRAEVSGLRQSSSWRITKPLRDLVTLIRKA